MPFFVQALIQNESATSNDIRLKMIQEKASQNEFLKLVRMHSNIIMLNTMLKCYSLIKKTIPTIEILFARN